MRTFLPACCLILLVGCRERTPPPNGGGSRETARRFAHTAIHLTSAPWDGVAVRLVLAERPITAKNPAAPFLWVRFNRPASELSKQHVTLGAGESRTGAARWCPRQGESLTLRSIEIRFETVKEGEPVRGHYAVTLPDGTREHDTFAAVWLASDGRGG